MKSILQGLSRIFEAVSIAFLATLCLSVFIQIIMRNVFSAGSIVLEELARFSLVTLVFLMIPVLAMDRKHIMVDFFILKLPVRLRRLVDAVIQILSAAATIFLLVAIAKIMERNWNVRTPAMRMPNVLFYTPVALGLLFTLLACIVNLFLRDSGVEATHPEASS
jgi:TRAP-type C4-dicarboxylate transport system permease small subunit